MTFHLTTDRMYDCGRLRSKLPTDPIDQKALARNCPRHLPFAFFKGIFNKPGIKAPWFVAGRQKNLWVSKKLLVHPPLLGISRKEPLPTLTNAERYGHLQTSPVSITITMSSVY